MRAGRILSFVGVLLLAVAVITLVTGAVTRAPVLVLVLLVASGGALVLGLARERSARPSVRGDADPARSSGRATIAVVALGAMGLATLAVAFTVAVGQAQGHAFSHWLFGAVALALFSALAFPWRPLPGTTASMVRTTVLALLAVAAFGSFLESLGGAGYDAANDGRRVAALAALHPVAMPLSALGLPGVPLGALVGIVVLTTWAIRRRRIPVT